MKTITTQLFTYSELSAPAQSVALETLRNQSYSWELHSLEEMADSLKAICTACCVKLTNWSFGAYDRNHKVTICHTMDDVSGPRALAWFLRILLANGYTRPKKFTEMQFPGVCGFTGCCYDDDAAETIWKALLDGDTVAEAFDAVAVTFCRNAEAEAEYQSSDENLLEYISGMGECFTADGEQF